MAELPLAGTNKVDRKVLGLVAREHWSPSARLRGSGTTP